MPKKVSAKKAIKDIRRKTRRRFSAEEKVRIVMKGLRGEDSVAELCRREGIRGNRHYRWSSDFLEAGKKWLAGDTKREATSTEVDEPLKQLADVKELVAEIPRATTVFAARQPGAQDSTRTRLIREALG